MLPRSVLCSQKGPRFNVFQRERPQVLPLVPVWGGKASVHIMLSSAVRHPDHEDREGTKGWLNQLPLPPTSGLVSGKCHGGWFWGAGNFLFLNLGADSMFMFMLWKSMQLYLIYLHISLYTLFFTKKKFAWKCWCLWTSMHIHKETHIQCSGWHLWEVKYQF